MKNFNGKQIAKKLGADKFRHIDEHEDVLYFINDDGIQEIYTIINGGKIILYDISYNINKPFGFFTPIVEIKIPIEVLSIHSLESGMQNPLTGEWLKDNSAKNMICFTRSIRRQARSCIILICLMYPAKLTD